MAPRHEQRRDAPQHDAQHLSSARADRDADANLAPAPRHRVGDTDREYRWPRGQREDAERTQRHGRRLAREQREAEHLLDRAGLVERQRRIERRDRLPHRADDLLRRQRRLHDRRLSSRCSAAGSARRRRASDSRSAIGTLPSSTTPMISVGSARQLHAKWRPIGSPVRMMVRAKARLTIATRGAPCCPASRSRAQARAECRASEGSRARFRRRWRSGPRGFARRLIVRINDVGRLIDAERQRIGVGGRLHAGQLLDRRRAHGAEIARRHVCCSRRVPDRSRRSSRRADPCRAASSALLETAKRERARRDQDDAERHLHGDEHVAHRPAAPSGGRRAPSFSAHSGRSATPASPAPGRTADRPPPSGAREQQDADIDVDIELNRHVDRRMPRGKCPRGHERQCAAGGAAGNRAGAGFGQQLTHNPSAARRRSRCESRARAVDRRRARRARWRGSRRRPAARGRRGAARRV